MRRAEETRSGLRREMANITDAVPAHSAEHLPLVGHLLQRGSGRTHVPVPTVRLPITYSTAAPIPAGKNPVQGWGPFFHFSRNARKAARTAGSRPRGMGTLAPLRIHSSPAESWAAAARLTM